MIQVLDFMPLLPHSRPLPQFSRFKSVHCSAVDRLKKKIFAGFSFLLSVHADSSEGAPKGDSSGGRYDIRTTELSFAWNSYRSTTKPDLFSHASATHIGSACREYRPYSA